MFRVTTFIFFSMFLITFEQKIDPEVVQCFIMENM